MRVLSVGGTWRASRRSSDTPTPGGASLPARRHTTATGRLRRRHVGRVEAPLVVMGIELLMPVHDITGVADIENDRLGFAIVRHHPTSVYVSRIASFNEGGFSSRDSVGC